MKFSRVEIVTDNAKLETLLSAVGQYGISGITVYQVLGCGVQYGSKEFEGGVKETPTLLPKQVAMVVMPTDQVDAFLKFVSEELYTGHIGDGKIFVSDIQEIMRVRTGEVGIEALEPQKH
ncbi:P-II family nitrogen regulator [uncultured Pseudoramibacter sp.]|uniref:P-II family nitrogen regulator n=1 Tax=uncultured Pseudoramibacter sp. TaxID=1623493 RepID=UPI0025E2CA72|nr:P-II family nitrogen regulator [uncultured Pseudoramibacter sp.]